MLDLMIALLYHKQMVYDTLEKYIKELNEGKYGT